MDRNDLIWRRDALKKFKEDCSDGISEKIAFIRIEEVPPAKIFEVKRGKWLEDEYGYIHCSECGIEWDEPEHKETNYCPNCGSDMRGKITMGIEALKEKIGRVILRRLDAVNLSCDDILSLSKAIAELEKNEVFKVVANAGDMCAFGGDDNG